MEETAGQKQEHEREGVDHARPEVVVGFVHVCCIADQNNSADHRYYKSDSMGDRVKDLLENIVSIGQHSQIARVTSAEKGVDRSESQRIAREIYFLYRLVRTKSLR